MGKGIRGSSMNDGKANRSYAEEGLEDLQAESNDNNLNVAPAASGEEEWVQTGGLKKIDRFYRFTEPKRNAKGQKVDKKGNVLANQGNDVVMQEGDELIGTYESSFISGTYKKPTFLIREANGTLSGIGGAGALEKEMLKHTYGTRVKIVYNGKAVIKDGPFKGNEAHTFLVFASRPKSA